MLDCCSDQGPADSGAGTRKASSPREPQLTRCPAGLSHHIESRRERFKRRMSMLLRSAADEAVRMAVKLLCGGLGLLAAYVWTHR
jgi:hypothetical protein